MEGLGALEEGLGALEEGLVFHGPFKGSTCIFDQFCAISACVCASLPHHLLLHSFQYKLLPCFEVERKSTSKTQQMQKQKDKGCEVAPSPMRGCWDRAVQPG